MINKINLQALGTKNLEYRIDQTNKHKDNNELYKAALEFEAIFVNQMLKSMKNSLNKENNLLNGGQTEEIFEDMLYLESAKQIAKSKSFGLTNLICDQLSEINNLKK
ncbi:muramidase [Candidatus Borreliella tachyglossi]|uniref:Muramidase n=1 Tax=Candidatus Borreliella tachyglossi TaxID=1964448 RepID=A0A2S1LXX0_9SPIR|nr:rod-binding protein [Candidatus Borreliella tachyglossi]AWG43122.1 muramidase [Candidatus Borreliella tachyglossi]